ncbi:MAG: hypothetical protein IKK02_01485, partial [Tidjanibacter sp.]|nr:hypothetical protein [Tidjanibacter sp.]
PLVSAEIPDFDLNKAINHGMLPRHYLIEQTSYLYFVCNNYKLFLNPQTNSTKVFAELFTKSDLIKNRQCGLS